MNNKIKNNKQAVYQRLNRVNLITVSILLVAFAGTLSAGPPAQHSHDPYFQAFTEHFFGRDFDWRLFKSQGFIESRLRQHVKSERGATGIMQLMPTTYREIQNKNNYFTEKDLNTVETNIAAGIFYNHYLYNRWLEQDISSEMRLNLMLASYNSGYSRTLKAWNKAGKPDADWTKVAKFLPAETRNYVSQILTHYTEQTHEDRSRQIVQNGNACPVAAIFERSFC